MNMPMGSALPDWVTPVAWTYIALSLISAAVIAADIYLLRHRHRSTISELVWVTSALYLGPFAIPAYLGHGRSSTSTDATRSSAPTTAGAVMATLPGGGASAVAHIIAVPLVAGVGWTIAGLAMWPMILVIALLATAILAGYERAASDGRAPAGGRLSVSAALSAALVTVVAFDIGMVGWMLLLHFNDLMPAVTEGAFWFLMQVGVIVGLATGYPAVKWLLSRHQSVVPA